MTSAIKSPFGARSTATEVIDGITLSGKRAVVTGASSGIGAEIARVLAASGADVTLAVRDHAAGQRVATSIAHDTGNDRVHVVPLDLADLESVATFSKGWTGPLHILVANAGLNLPDLRRTPAGVELTFAICHLGHFALTLGLHDALASAAGARVVSVSSPAHLGSPVVFDDISFTSRAYSGILGYGQAKTANVLMAVALTKHWAPEGILANAAAPGIVTATRLSRYRTAEQDRAFMSAYRIPPEFLKSVEEGAATPVFAATSPLLDGTGGRYIEDCHEATVRNDCGDGFSGVAGYALEPATAERLWDESLRLLAESGSR